jgi:SAM-dependent methyltransferase
MRNTQIAKRPDAKRVKRKKGRALLTYQPTLGNARFLLSEEGNTWLEHAAQLPDTPASHLANLSYLRRHLTVDQAAAVLEQARLRVRATPRFDRAARMLFTQTGLEQTTHPIVAAHRARRFQGRSLVADLGCGLGSDTVALAQAAEQVLALDQDPVRLMFARHNVDAYRLSDQVAFVEADVLALPFNLTAFTHFCDPGRRTVAGQRIFRPQDYEPPLSLLWERLAPARGLAIKVAPGIPYERISWVDEVEIVSLNGQVKEATLWCRDLATPKTNRRATLLPSGVTVTDVHAADECPVRPVGRYLYEPDGAVIRAGLVQQVGTTLGLWRLDDRIAYLSGDTPIASPFVHGFEVEEILPFGLKSLRRRLRELGVGVLEIKKRGVALDPDAFRRRLKLRGAGSKTLIITRVGDKPVALLCQRKKTWEISETPHV